jgi:hypothetical protein
MGHHPVHLKVRHLLGQGRLRFCHHYQPRTRPGKQPVTQVAHQCVCVSFPPSDLELNFSLSHTIAIHRWPGTITLAIISPRTPLPRGPPSLLHPATSLPSSNFSPACDRTSDLSKLASRPTITKIALGRHRRSDQLTAVLLHRQRWREVQGQSSAALTNLDAVRSTSKSHVYAYGMLLGVSPADVLPLPVL